MGKCRDCLNFRPAVNLEVSEELDYDSKVYRGTCSTNNNRRNSSDECGCGEFQKNK